jgi:hypothetical protein
MNNPFAYLSFAGSVFNTGVPLSVEQGFSFAGGCEEIQPSYMPDYLQHFSQYHLQNEVQMPFYEPQVNNSAMLNHQVNNIPTIMDDDELLRDLFSMDEKPMTDMPVVSSFAPITPLDAETMQHSEAFCGVMLPQNLIEQIMAADATQDSGSVLEMLRNNIRTSMEVHATPVVPADTRPALNTEVIHHEKKEKKGGVKKRRYVKSGLYRKDKSGNFIYSSSDRARLAGEETKGGDSAQPQEQPDSSAQSNARVKRPLNAYNIFCKLHFEQVKTENPELSINELSKLMGEKWKAMSTSQKKSYYDKVEHGQTRYKKPLNSYNLFCKKNFDALKKEFPHKSIHVLSKVIAERWKKLSESEKKVYYDEVRDNVKFFTH